MSLKVVSIVDKVGTALDRLAKGVAPYMNGIDYHVIDVHPKRPDPEQLARFEQLARTADIIDAQYYRSIEMLRERYSWAKEIPTILTHNNPYAIHEGDWNQYNIVVANNKSIYEDLKKITQSQLELIPLVVDPLFWRFNDDYKADKSVVMVANRIEGKKGILPVAKACQHLGIKMYLVGAISDPEYWRQIMATGVVHFGQEISDTELRDIYHKSGLHVCNSVDNFESGTLPALEAIFCGVPVLSRRVGHMPEIIQKYDYQNLEETNIFVNDHDPEDVDNLITQITEAFADKNRLERMRHEAWFSIKDRNFERRAYQYQRLYRELLGDNPVSVIVPVAGKEEIARENLNAIANQTHKNIEVIVVDDGEVDQQANIRQCAETMSFPVKYYRMGGEGYNLAKARNKAAIESTSDILVFCDQRMVMANDAVEQFVSHILPNTWLYGNKGVKKEFVENFSAVNRDDFMRFGMFNEQITQYGGLSQETRSRARKQGMNIEFVESAKADPKGKSSNRKRKKYEIMASKNMLWKVGMM